MMPPGETENDDGGWDAARFPIRLNLPNASASHLHDAREAVAREFRESITWKQLRCRDVTQPSASENQGVFILEVGHAIELDWNWQGAVAFSPLKKEIDQMPLPDDIGEIEVDGSMLWSGEILEVDEENSRIFVNVDPRHPPITGSFYIRPFAFLAGLHAIFNESRFARIRERLPSHLLAATGNVHPDVDEYVDVGLGSLREWWSKSWSVLWGPAGTGKTYTTGHQVARILADKSERVLVVSTTNRATDAAAIAVGRAAREVAPNELADGLLLRIGKGASLQKMETEKLSVMLTGTETEFLAQIEDLAAKLLEAPSAETRARLRREMGELRSRMRDAAQRNFLDKRVRVIVATAFRAMAFVGLTRIKDDLESGYAPFTTIFIDEAGLISRAATAALALLASRRVVLVGDSKQLAPISRMSRVLPTNQMTWLANSGVSHLDTFTTDQSGVHILQTQRRMHADICSVVSAYQYDGCLATAPEVIARADRIPDILAGQPRAIWYVLDEDGDDLPAIRAERGPGHRSWIRTITRKVLTRLFTDKTFCAANGIFISPFRAQTTEISTFLRVNGYASWSASTVHSQQGSEADVVIFDTVNAGSYGWPYDEWKRMTNVALSRAREVVILLASRAEMEEPYLQPLLKSLAPRVLKGRGSKLTWHEVDPHAVHRTSGKLSNRQSEFARCPNRQKEGTSTSPFSRAAATMQSRAGWETAARSRRCGKRKDGRPCKLVDTDDQTSGRGGKTAHMGRRCQSITPLACQACGASGLGSRSDEQTVSVGRLLTSSTSTTFSDFCYPKSALTWNNMASITIAPPRIIWPADLSSRL